jgi:hypothetical protein
VLGVGVQAIKKHNMPKMIEYVFAFFINSLLYGAAG